VLLGKIPGNRRGKEYANRDFFPLSVPAGSGAFTTGPAEMLSSSAREGKGGLQRKSYGPGKIPGNVPDRYILHRIGSSVFLMTVRRVNEELIRRTPGRLASLPWVLVKSVLSRQTTRRT
jgi:hypothetical protein